MGLSQNLLTHLVEVPVGEMCDLSECVEEGVEEYVEATQPDDVIW